MAHSGSVEGEGYDMNAAKENEGGGMSYKMAGPGMESSKGEKSPEANTKGKMKEDRR